MQVTHTDPKRAPAIYLAGDSTTSSQSRYGGGWGPGFLDCLGGGAIGANLAYNGATTESFVGGGAWANVIDAVRRSAPTYQTYAMIQFGHNDQKANSGICIDQFSANLRAFGLDVRQAGGLPIFVSPLSRRNFNSSGELEDDLREQRSATIAVATCLDADFVDLNAVSRQYLQAIGRGKASRYNLIPSDFTHLNELGSRIFGTMVGWYLTTSTAAGKDLSPFVYLDPIIVNAIVEGTDIVGA